MYTSFDLETILFNLLKTSTTCNGGVYAGEDSRPADDNREAIVINTIDLTTDTSPQRGTTNVNIYVPDTQKTINGTKTTTSNRQRLRVLTGEVMTILRGASISKCKIVPGNETLQNESNIGQHYVNIRVVWNICH